MTPDYTTGQWRIYLGHGAPGIIMSDQFPDGATKKMLVPANDNHTGWTTVILIGTRPPSPWMRAVRRIRLLAGMSVPPTGAQRLAALTGQDPA